MLARVDALVEPADNFKFDRVNIAYSQRLKLPCLNLLAALCISIPVASTTCVPRPSEGGDDAVSGRLRLRRLRNHDLAISMVPRS